MSLATITIIGVVVVGVLFWLFVRTRSKDLIDEMMVKRRPSSRLVSRADFVEGPTHIPVALSLGSDTICYENSDLDACLELGRIEEIEYDDETATGQSVTGKALRLRAHGQTFEFVLDPAVARQWESTLAAKHFDQGTARAV